jgi:TatA/E family protein of Tat protein translocase
MGELLTPSHLMVVAVIAFVLFGGKKLPELGKGLGEGLPDSRMESRDYSVFTSGAYRATAPNATFPQDPGSPASKLAGVEEKPHFAVLSCSE